MRRVSEITGAEIRAAMFGSPVPGLRVERQARRLTETDSDELAVLDGRGSWWIAQRRSDRLTVWMYIGQDEAEDAFERMLADAARRNEPWHEARPGTRAA